MDWMTHLEHLHTVFREFNANVVILESVLIRLFRDGLRPSIRAPIEQEGRRKDIWDLPIRKAITAEVKAALNLSFWVREMDVCCFRGQRSAPKPTEDHTLV